MADMIPTRKRWDAGRYEGVPNHVYHSGIDALNMSTLKLMDTSAAHCRDSVLNPDLYGDYTKQKQANFDHGSALHTIIIEPALFDETYAVHPEGNKNSKAYKEEAAPLIAEGFILLEQKVIDSARRARDKIYSEPSDALDILNAQTAGEVSYVVDSPFEGIQYKVRPDIMVEGAGLVVDLKSTISAENHRFEKQMTDLDYHYSKPFYMDALEIIEPGKWTQHLFLAVEKVPPYEFAIFDVDPESTALAQREVDRLIAAYATCHESGKWGGYPREVQSVGVTGYEWTRVERADERREEYGQ